MTDSTYAYHEPGCPVLRDARVPCDCPASLGADDRRLLLSQLLALLDPERQGGEDHLSALRRIIAHSHAVTGE